MLSVLVAVMLTVDSVAAFGRPGQIGSALGAFLITSDTAAFWGYMLSCHVRSSSCRRSDLRNSPGTGCVTERGKLSSITVNIRHGLFALISLPMVIVTDGTSGYSAAD